MTPLEQSITRLARAISRDLTPDTQAAARIVYALQGGTITDEEKAGVYEWISDQLEASA